MQKTTMEKLNAQPSRLGFGAMRLPTTPQGEIDEMRAAAMVARAYEAGVSYFDTAYFYHNHKSEAFMGRALSRFPRQSYYLATKLPLTLVHTVEEAQRVFKEQLVDLQTDYFDFYLLHAINRERWHEVLQNGVLDYVLGLQREGKVRHLGFSFHDNYDAFEEILTARAWDFCQIQFNYMDRDEQAGMRGYELAQRLGVPLIIMEPVKGGSLATLSEEVAAPMKRARPDRSLASWAMRWVASLPNCRVILSGMSTEEQLEDNIATFSHFEPLTPEELQIVEGVRKAILDRQFVGCTRCRYCMPCPFGVDIPGNFAIMNRYAMYANEDRLRADWKNMDAAARANACRKCGKCEKVCPQGLPIREKLGEIAARMRS